MFHADFDVDKLDFKQLEWKNSTWALSAVYSGDSTLKHMISKMASWSCGEDLLGTSNIDDLQYNDVPY